MDFYNEWMRQLREVEANLFDDELQIAIAQEIIAARLLGNATPGSRTIASTLKISRGSAMSGLSDLSAAAPELFSGTNQGSCDE
jgi:hypothetical protein